MAMLREKIRAARDAAGFTPAEAASKLGIHPVTLSKWENGRSRIRYDNLVRLSHVFGQPLDYWRDDEVPAIPVAPVIRAKPHTRKMVDIDALTRHDAALGAQIERHIQNQVRLFQATAGLVSRLARELEELRGSVKDLKEATEEAARSPGLGQRQGRREEGPGGPKRRGDRA